MVELSLDIVDDPSDADIDLVRERLNAYNAGFVPDSGYRPLAVFLRDADGRTLGGLVASTYWGWLHIDLLWVDDGLHGAGWGSRLLAAGEEAARARGCRAAVLSTLSFQAPAFYRAHGYVVAGEIPDLPPGHRRLYMTKVFAPNRAKRP